MFEPGCCGKVAVEVGRPDAREGVVAWVLRMFLEDCAAVLGDGSEDQEGVLHQEGMEVHVVRLSLGEV